MELQSDTPLFWQLLHESYMDRSKYGIEDMVSGTETGPAGGEQRLHCAVSPKAFAEESKHGAGFTPSPNTSFYLLSAEVERHKGTLGDSLLLSGY